MRAEHQRHRGPRRRQRAQGHAGGPGEGEQSAAPYRAVQAPMQQPAAAEERADHVGQRTGGHRDAVLRRAQAEHLDIGKRRGREQREQAAIGGRDQQRPGLERRVREHRACIAGQCRSVQCPHVAHGQRLRHFEPGVDQNEHRKDRHRSQRTAPAQHHRQHAAEQRCGDRQHAEPRQAERHDARALVRLVEVAHHRPCTDHRCGHRGALRDAPGDQPADVRGERGADAGQHQQGQAGEQHRAAAEAVGDRAPHQLRQPESQDQRRHRQLRRAHRCAQVARQQRQCRQVEVGHHRLQAEQQRQRDRRHGGCQDRGAHCRRAAFAAGCEFGHAESVPAGCIPIRGQVLPTVR